MRKKGGFREIVSPYMGVNTSDKERLESVKTNVKRPIPQLRIYDAHPDPIILLCGGPSINREVKEIQKLRKKGHKLCTVNGSYQWALDHDLLPSLQIMLDGRAWNKRFLENLRPETQYFLCSHCHPETFEALNGHKVSMFHCPGSKAVAKVVNDHFFGMWLPVKGGTTIALRGIHLLYALGFRKIAIYGMDSCYLDKAHHAYEQKENDIKTFWEVKVGRKLFITSPWMASQAEEFMHMTKVLPPDLKLAVFGDGLIAEWMRETHKRGRPVEPRFVGEFKFKKEDL